MPHSKFGWDYPPGVTGKMIDDAFGSDEHISSACEQGLHADGENGCNTVECTCECHDGQTQCEACGERVANDLIVSGDERAMGNFMFLCSTCYRRLFGHRKDEPEDYASPARCPICGWRGMAISSDCPACGAVALVGDEGDKPAPEPERRPVFYPYVSDACLAGAHEDCPRNGLSADAIDRLAVLKANGLV